MKKIKSILSTHIGRLALAAIISVLGGLIMNLTEDKFYIGTALLLIGFGTLFAYFFVMMYYAIKGTWEDIKNNG